MADVPEAFHDLFEGQAVATFITLMPDGMPHPTPVWIDYDPGTEQTEPWERSDGPRILVNTAEGRQKHRNVSRDSRVAGTIIDPDDPYRYLSFQGRVAEAENEGAVDHIHALAQRYMGVEEYPNLEDETAPRIVLRIEVENVLTS